MRNKFAFVILFPALVLIGCKNRSETAAVVSLQESTVLTSVTFNADSAFTTIEDQCAFGPRVPNSSAHKACGNYILERFKAYGLDVMEQNATLSAWDGKNLHMRNIIAAYAPEREDRVMICTHWESRPWADEDPDEDNHRKPVPAANDGASGVGVMIEVARLLEELQPEVGVDFICFDLEDYGTPYWDDDKAPADGTDWCMGSEYWSNHPHQTDYAPRFGILLDMVGGKDAQFRYEGVSLFFARDVVVKVWEAAASIGADNIFLTEEGTFVQDDHVRINEITGIPTIDIIPYVPGGDTFGKTWHTLADTPENISKETLRAVGQTLLQVLSEEQAESR